MLSQVVERGSLVKMCDLILMASEGVCIVDRLWSDELLKERHALAQLTQRVNL